MGTEVLFICNKTPAIFRINMAGVLHFISKLAITKELGGDAMVSEMCGTVSFSIIIRYMSGKIDLVTYGLLRVDL